MTQIRSHRVASNKGGRVGCQVQSPFTNQIYYVSLEHGDLVLRDWGKRERARERGVTLTPLDLSADFAQHGQVCVTVGGFPANTDDSGLDTYILEFEE